MYGLPDGSIHIDTKIDQSGLSSGLNQLGSLAAKGLGVITKAVGLVGTGLSVAGGFAIKTGMEFDSAMSQVAATWGKTAEEIAVARQAAIDYGASTSFSATEAAQALNYLALAGYGVEQAVDVLPAVLDLAAAGNMDLAYASDLATDAMAALGIEASKENLVEFGDKMAATASHANTSVSQLGEAIITVGGTAKQLAGGTDELNTALGVLANRGIKGSEAGTNMRNIILALIAPTKDAADAMKELGVSAVDATTGSLKPLNEVMADFNKATAKMSNDARQQYLSRIFNRYDLAAVENLLSGCGEEWNELIGYVEEADDAMSQMATTQLDNLAGDVENFSGALESLGIAASDVMNSKLRNLVQLGTSFIDSMTKGVQTGGFTGLASAMGGVLSEAIAAVGDYLPDITQMAVDVIKSLASGLVKAAPDLGTSAAEIVTTLISGSADVLPDIVRAGLSIATSLGDGLIKNMPTIASDLVTGLTGALGEIVGAGNQIAGSLVGTLGNVSWDGLAGTIGTFVSGLLGSIVDAIPAASSLLSNVAQVLIDGIVSAIKGIATVGSSIMDAIVGALTQANENNAGGAIGEAGASILNGILKAITDISDTPDMTNLVKQIGVGIGEALIFLGDIAGSIISYILSPEGLTAFFNAGVSIIKIIGDGVGAAFTGLVEGIANFGQYIAEQIASIFGFDISDKGTIIDQANAYMQSLAEGTAESADDYGDQFSAAGISALNYVIEGMNSGAGDIEKFAIVAAGLIASGMGDGLDEISPQLEYIAGRWIDTIKDATDPASLAGQFKTIGITISEEMASSLIGAFQSSDADAILTALSQVFGFEIPKTISEALNQETVWESVAKEGDAIGQVLTDSINSAVEGSGGVDNAVATGLAAAAESAEDDSAAVLAAIPAAIKAGTPQAQAAVSAASEAIVEEVTNQFSAENGTAIANSFIGAITEQITTGQEGMVTAANATATATLSAIESVLSFSAGSSIGSDLASGVAFGISSSVAIITTAATTMAMAAVTAATSALGIHSPSTVARDAIGKQFTAGIGVGIEENEGVVLSAIGRLARNVSGQEIGGWFTDAARYHANSVSAHAQDAGETIAAHTPSETQSPPQDDYEAIGEAIARRMPTTFTLEDVNGEYIGTIAEPTVSEIQAQEIKRRG